MGTQVSERPLGQGFWMSAKASGRRERTLPARNANSATSVSSTGASPVVSAGCLRRGGLGLPGRRAVRRRGPTARLLRRLRGGDGHRATVGPQKCSTGRSSSAPWYWIGSPIQVTIGDPRAEQRCALAFPEAVGPFWVKGAGHFLPWGTPRKHRPEPSDSSCERPTSEPLALTPHSYLNRAPHHEGREGQTGRRGPRGAQAAEGG